MNLRILFISRSLVFLAAMTCCHAAEVCFESLLLAPGPAQTMHMKGDLESEMALLLAGYPKEERALFQSRIVFSATAKRSVSQAERPLMVTSDNPLAVSIQHLCELYVCKSSLQDGKLCIESLDDTAEFVTREYHLSPVLVQWVLGKEAGEGRDVKALFQDKAMSEKFDRRLEAQGLRLVGLGEHFEKVMLCGESLAHECFTAEVSLLLLKALKADVDARVSRPKVPAGK
jgi:hypothetical protein